MKTILHVVQHLAPGGLEAMVLDMLAFTDPKHQIMVVSLDGTLDSALKGWPRLKEYQHQLIFLNKNPGFSLSVINQLLTIFKQYKIDVVHSHHIGPLLYSGFAVMFNRKVNHVHTEHDAWHLNTKKHFYLQKLALSLSKPKLVADANFVKNTLENIFQEYPIHTIKNGIDPCKFTAGNKHQARKKLGLNLPENAKVIGNAARLEAVKGHPNLIEAMTFLKDDYHLLLAGSGTQKKYLQHLTRQYKLEDRIHFLGHVEHMPAFYQSLDVFCLPSNNEGFPLSTLEAQSCGIPCVAHNVGGVSETLCPISSKLVNNNLPLSLATAIEELTNQQIQDNPRTFILNNNNAKSMASAYENLYFSGVSI
ncbi:glycosyltransferase [Aliivibrio logei]|uniref:glycosyltransferase n=1 Tax=Aliivibrio logei TaxID=688 RepID=UPI0035C88150